MCSNLIYTLKELFIVTGDFLAGLYVCPFLKDPWIIVLIAITCIILLVRGMERALVSLISILALLVLFQNTTQNFTVPGCFTEQLPIFVCGCLAIAATNLYMFLLRS